MLYAIKVYEDMYGGRHGMNTKYLEEYDDVDDLITDATNESIEVMDSYSDIYENLEREAAEEYEEGSDEYFDYLYDLKLQNVAFNYWEIPNMKGHDIAELENMFYYDEDNFIKEYCKDIDN